MKKGFTLVELIAVISLIALIGLISVPIVEGAIKRSKTKVYNNQINEIKMATKKALTENPDLITGDSFNICVSKLKELGHLENNKIIDPRDNSVINGTVQVTYNSQSNSFFYNYVENTCVGG